MPKHLVVLLLVVCLALLLIALERFGVFKSYNNDDGDGGYGSSTKPPDSGTDSGTGDETGSGTGDGSSTKPPGDSGTGDETGSGTGALNSSTSSPSQQSGLKKISSGYTVPVETYSIAARRAVPMNATAIQFLKSNYSPNLVGVPGQGEPTRLSLDIPIDDATLRGLMTSLAKALPGEQCIFIKTSNPPALLGYMAQITGENVVYCQEGEPDCSPVDVYVAKF